MSKQKFNFTNMKVTLSIDQAQKSGFFSGTTNSYKMNVQFKLNEKEKKIFNDHPLFQEMFFMSYLAGEKERFANAHYRKGYLHFKANFY